MNNQIPDLPEKLYLIAVETNSIPFLVQGNIILLYSEKDRAEKVAQSFDQSHEVADIKAFLIENNLSFFAKMASYGFNRFILDGSGSPLNFSDYCTVKPCHDIERFKNEIEYAQPLRKVIKVKPKLTPQSVSDAYSVLGPKQKKRLIAAYIWGIISVSCSTILGLFKHSKSIWLSYLFLLAIASILKGLDTATKVSGKVKEKNPIIAKFAMLSCWLHLVAVIIFAILMSA